jgi:tetratricopeptide (TPR) repeat protein
LAATVLLGVAGMGCQKLKARDELNKGVQAFRSGAYPVAVEHFKLAVSLDPTYPNSRAYLATSYMMQYIPGAESEDNIKMATQAHNEFLKVLELDPKNANAIAAIAQLYFNEKKLDESRDWFNKLIATNPNDKTGYYTIGVIAWMKTYKPRMTARAELGMRPDDPGPIRDKKVREQLKAQNMPFIEEGMQALTKAVAIDKEYEDAMTYLNLLYRERADLADTVDAHKKDTAEADSWLDKTMQTKKIKAARIPAAGGLTAGK